MVYRTYHEMAHIDQMLRGAGYPERIPKKNVSDRIAWGEKMVGDHQKAVLALTTTLNPKELHIELHRKMRP